jgi:hypothetical protein
VEAFAMPRKTMAVQDKSANQMQFFFIGIPFFADNSNYDTAPLLGAQALIQL